nr:MAG TPA: hypothetical protein [Caudoviricetes sp.]
MTRRVFAGLMASVKAGSIPAPRAGSRCHGGTA